MKKRVFKDSAITAVVFALPKAVSLLLLPIYTSFVSPEQLGIIELFALGFTIIQFVFTAEISQALARFLPLEEERTGKSLVFSTAFWFNLACWTVVFSCTALNAGVVSSAIGSEYVSARIVLLAFAAMLLQSQYNLLNLSLRFTGHTPKMAVASLISSMTTSVLTVSMLYFTELRLEALILGPVFGNFLGFLYAYSASRKVLDLNAVLDSNRLKRMLKYSLPFVLSSSGLYLVSSIDRWMINALLPLQALGHYSFAFKLASIIAIFTSAVQASLTPLIYSNLNSRETSGDVEQLFRVFLAVGGVVVVGLETFSILLLPRLVDPVYSPAFDLVAPAACSVLLMTGYIFFPGLDIALKSRTLAFINVCVGLLNLLLNYLLIPVFGVVGAISTSVLSGFVMMLAYSTLGQKYFSIPFRWPSILSIIGLSLLAYFAQRLLLSDPVLKTLLYLAYVGIILVIMRDVFKSFLNSRGSGEKS